MSAIKGARARRARRMRKPAASMLAVDNRAVLARRLDMMAGVELQHGHHLAAERLAWRAAELREVAR